MCTHLDDLNLIPEDFTGLLVPISLSNEGKPYHPVGRKRCNGYHAMHSYRGRDTYERREANKYLTSLTSTPPSSPPRQWHRPQWHHLDIIWTFFGHHLDIIWISFGHHLDIIWLLFGHHFNIISTSFGHHLDII